MLGVGKRFRSSEWVVPRVGLQTQPGELVVLHGANGSGKSSLLRMMTGISRVIVGDISGRPATIDSPRPGA
jgi:ABC-2 type transport system ATP-binding protein